MYLDVTCILHLLNNSSKKVSQIYFFIFLFFVFVCLYTFFSSTEIISRDDSSRLPYDVSDMFFIAPCLANLSDTSFQ